MFLGVGVVMIGDGKVEMWDACDEYVGSDY